MRRSSPTFSHRNVSRGFTLLEMILALTVVVVLATIASPPIMRTWRDQRLAEATENVRSMLGGTRIRAVDNDETWQFRYEPGGTKFVRTPLTSLEDENGETSTRSGRDTSTLPEGITFETDDAGTAPPLDQKLLDGLPNSGELSSASWATPVLFYSDGTASQAAFRIVDEYGGSREITVRDLTGAVTSRRPSTL